MTDNEVIKALKICSTKGGSCKDCPAFVKVDRSNCKKALVGALDIINRQKAEIAEYPIKTLVGNNCMICSKTSKDYDNLIADIKSEAIREFAERLKESLEWRTEPIDDYDIDELVKEMTEVKNDKE